MTSGGRAGSTRSPPGRWRLLAPALLGWACAAFAITQPGSGRWLALGGGGLGLSLLVTAALRRDRLSTGLLRIAAVACAVLLLLGTRIDISERVRSDPELLGAAEERRPLEFEVLLRGFPESSDTAAGPRSWVRAQAETASGNVPVILWLEGDAESRWAPGTRLEVGGRPDRLEPGSAAAYGIGVDRILADSSAAPAAGLPEALALLRLRLREAASTVPGAELVPGFAVGDTGLVDEALERDMLESSLVHLVAVSGANCALVTSAVTGLAALLGAGRRVRTLLAGAGLAGFVLIVGPDASVQRAAVMAAVVLISGYGGKRAVALPALGVAVLALLLLDPWQALHPGFALSVAATGGILLLVPALEAGLVRRLRAPRWLALPIAVATAAQLACGPLLLLLQPGIPAVGILANVLAAPAAPLGTGLGLVALLALPLSAPLGAFAVRAASVPARWVAGTAEVASELPLARWPWPEGWAGALLLAAVQTAALLSWALATGRLGLRGERSIARVPWGSTPPRPPRVRLAAALLLCSACGTFAGVTLVSPVVARIGIPSNWSAVACDVGQGDALLLRDPDRPQENVLVDTGDDPELLASCLQRFGVTRIALLVLTHDDRDHVGALSEVAPLAGAVLVAPANAEDGPDRPVLEQLRAEGLDYTVGAAGTVGGEGALHWEALAPEAGRTPSDANSGSLVLRVRAGDTTILLLADTGRDEHRELLRSGADLRADVVKVAHHGSRDQDPELLEAIGAEVALISVGEGNGYGHPSPDTLASLERAGTRALRTDRMGSIAVSGTGSGLGVWVERGS